MCKAFYALAKHLTPKGDYFAPKGHYFEHWCGKRPLLLSLNGAQTRVLHACLENKIFIGGSKSIKKIILLKMMNFVSIEPLLLQLRFILRLLIKTGAKE